ncbi:MAG: (2Fe-2S)-binding protein [Polyangiaceae bacterium]|nr:(2Fe-2S)-binding protein [Polyangiaceae bacterium]
MYVCCCIGVTDKTIRAAIDEGATTVQEVTRCTRAGSRCGSCRPEIASMLVAQGFAAAAVGFVAPRRLPMVMAPSRTQHAHGHAHEAEHAGDRSAA